MFLSVIVNNYNRSSFLDRPPTAYRQQSHKDFEIVVADDGSTDDSREVAARHQATAPFQVCFVTHPHEGHRRAAILNRGILASTASWLLFTDCDSLPARDLLEVHSRSLVQRKMLIGGRIRLTPEETAALTLTSIERGEYERLLDGPRRLQLAREHARNVVQLLMRRARRPHNLGLNFSIEKESLFSVNGYDENFRGWGNADGDLRERLKRVGVWPKSIWNRAVVFHMHHEPDPTRAERRNAEYSRRPNIPIFCEQGLFRPPAAAPATPVRSGETRPHAYST